MQKTLKALTPLSLLIRFLAMSGLGLLILAKPMSVGRSLKALCIAALLLNGLPAIAVSVFQKKEPHPHAFISGLVSVAVAVLLMLFPDFLRGSVTLAVGLWSLLVSAVQFGYVAQLSFTHEKGKLKFFLLGVISLLMAVAMLSSLSSGRALRWTAGVFLILYGLWQLMDMLGVLINRNVESSALLSRLRIKPPVLLTAMLPSILLRRLREQYQTLDKNIVQEKPTPPRHAFEETLDVIFHLGEDVAFGFGHVDVSLRGHTYSYGCYDEQSNRIFGLLSDGTFLVCGTPPYLRYCQQIENKLLIGFTLGISREHAGAMEAGMARMLHEACEPWKPEQRPEYAIGATFYKVKKGKFAVYNALRTNCAAMAEILAASGGLNLLPPNGFVTPGAYYDYLQSELRDPESSVLRQTIYAHQP